MSSVVTYHFLLPVLSRKLSVEGFATSEMYRMSPSQLFIGAHFQFQFCTYSIRCVFRYFQFSLQSFDSISSDVRVHFSYFFSCAREKRDEREKTQNKNPHQRESNVRKKKTEMHEVRVMCNGHKNSIRTNTCDQRKESVVVFFISLSFYVIRFLMAPSLFYWFWIAFSASKNMLWCAKEKDVFFS